MGAAASASHPLQQKFGSSFIVFNLLGNISQVHVKLEDALHAYYQAIKFTPDFVEAYSNCGVILRNLGRLGESPTCINKVIRYS